jgi:prolyl-tRNA synthetase
MRPRLGLLLLLAVSVEMIAAFRSAGLAGRRLAVLRRGAAAAAAASTAAGLDDVVASIKSTGDRIRELKAAKADKAVLQPELEQLLSLKAKYQVLAGAPYDPPKPGAGKKKEETAAAVAPASAAAASAESLVITPRGTDYSAWYSDVISAADMVDQSPVRGCMVIKPWGMGVWDLLRAELDERIRDSKKQQLLRRRRVASTRAARP